MEDKNKAPVKKGWLSWYFNFNLLYRILIGLVIGAVLGLIFKEKILWIAPFGSLFVRLLKMIMMPIILSTLSVGASSVSPANLGRVGNPGHHLLSGDFRLRRRRRVADGFEFPSRTRDGRPGRRCGWQGRGHLSLFSSTCSTSSDEHRPGDTSTRTSCR
jgi:hypothetical protein